MGLQSFLWIVAAGNALRGGGRPGAPLPVPRDPRLGETLRVCRYGPLPELKIVQPVAVIIAAKSADSVFERRGYGDLNKAITVPSNFKTCG